MTADRVLFWDVSEADHRILNPLSDTKLDLVGRTLRLAPGSSVVDLGCGKGEALARWAADLGARGVGIDLHPGFVETAHGRAEELGVPDRVRFDVGDAARFSTGEPFDAGVCLGATWIGGGTAGTVDLLRTLVRPGGHVALGEVFFHEPPAPGDEDLMAGDGPAPELADVVGLIEAAGTEVVDLVVAGPEDWDRYQASQWHNVTDWLRSNPDHPQADEFRATNEAWKRAYLAYGRRRWGWAVFVARLG